MSDETPFTGRTVLVVEDEMMVAWRMEDMLADLGCTVVGPAGSVDQALAMIDAQVLDAAMLDVNLNGEMSYPVADRLVARGVPFVFSTGYDRDRLQEGYRTRPILRKSFQASDLRAALDSLLGPTQDQA